MEWSEVNRNWTDWSARIQKRFPLLDCAEMERTRHDRRAFEAYLARTHNLSLNEAHEEIDDLLFLESLAAELAPIQGRM